MIRTAQLADAGAIAAIHVRGWQAAYAHILPAAFLDSLSVEKRTVRWHSILALTRAGETHVYVEGATVLGWIDWGPSRDPDRNGEAEVLAIYVSPDHWQRGIGRQLMQRAEAGVSSRGIARITLWVLEQNTSGRRFYERLGYAADGARKIEDVGGVQATELRYAKNCPAPGATA
jgi:ribosomal protein S18 acetylase RimI-like enzyme